MIEIQAYRDLQNESFCFDGVNNIKKEDQRSMDAHYEIMEDNIIDKIEDIKEKKLVMKQKERL